MLVVAAPTLPHARPSCPVADQRHGGNRQARVQASRPDRNVSALHTDFACVPHASLTSLKPSFSYFQRPTKRS
jgi:hypothetical protein